MSQSPLQNLPGDLKRAIMKHLGTRDLMRLAATSTAMREAVIRHALAEARALAQAAAQSQARANQLADDSAAYFSRRQPPAPPEGSV